MSATDPDDIRAAKFNAMRAERDEVIAERDEARKELDPIHDVIRKDWMGRESMTAAECVRRILGERDLARDCIERAKDTLNDPKRRERIAGAWAILTEGQET